MQVDKLWDPVNPGNTSMDKYRQHVNQKYNQRLRNSFDLHRWSIERPHDFWIDLWTYMDLKPRLPPDIEHAYDPTKAMSLVPPFFPGVGINYAENALFDNPDPNAIALVDIQEGTDSTKDQSNTLTWQQFRDQVRLAASALRRAGVQTGDRVAAMIATSSPVVILFHAAATIGAIFTCVSPDLGAAGCISRFRQVNPKILFVDSHTLWKGKTTSTLPKVREILSYLSPVPKTYVVPVASSQHSYPSFKDFMSLADPSEPLTFVRVPFSNPLLICYSSGTTGDPKCIVHQHGVIIQLKKIAAVHNGTTTKDVILQYSSTSWIVFYVMCGYLACGAKTILYNGSPMYPDTSHLLRLVERYRVTYFGTSPRYLLEVEMSKTIPKNTFDLSSLRIAYTTGAPLSADQYKWFYTSFPPHIHLCNTAGGTDTCTSLIAADPSSPIHAGEMQIFALGMDVDILDPETGSSIAHTTVAGEMVIRSPFPSMPCFFWGDETGQKYHETYFERFEGVGLDVWAQADWLSRNGRTGGLVMHGRSDGVLNPAGIRFGSGEIYAVVEGPGFTREISDTLCVGRRRPGDRDEVVFLFVVMVDGFSLQEELVERIKGAIRTALSPRHVPAFVLQVLEIPTTINGKKVEAAVKQTLSGKDVQPSNTVSNPDSIAYYRRFRDLESQPRSAKL